MARFYAGLDVHSKLTQVVIQDEVGRVVSRDEVPTTPEGLGLLRSKHKLPAGTQVALETGTMAHYVARQLQALALKPVVVDAHEVRAKAHRPRQKSDRRDAFEACDGLRRDLYRTIVPLPPIEIQVLRETLSRRRHFIRVQVSEVNAVKHVLRSSGQRHLSLQLKRESAWQSLLSRVADARLGSQIEFHHQVWRAAGDQVAELNHSLLEQSTLFESDFLRLQTVPGVGPIVALTVLAAFWDANRFPTAQHASSYAGLVPTTSQSGDRDHHGRITKQGSPELRAMLVEAAHHACRTSHPLSPYFRSMCARRGYKMAVVAVAHRLCRILYAMLRDEAEFDVTKINVEVGPFEKKIVLPYRLKGRRDRN
jgi:transposase